jgi:hypothetical protein
MKILRHGPLVFWLSVVAVLVAAVVVALSVDVAPELLEARPATVSEQRHELLEVRTQMGLLVSLGRAPGPELADEAAVVAELARGAAERAAPASAALYRELADELDRLADYVSGHYTVTEPEEGGPGEPSGPQTEGQVLLSQLETLPALPSLPTIPAGDSSVAGTDSGTDSSTDSGTDSGSGVGDASVRSEVARRLTRILALADRLVPLVGR